jgi:dTDP-4-amino-4,6-dideoxygalactose transaminase
MPRSASTEVKDATRPVPGGSAADEVRPSGAERPHTIEVPFADLREMTREVRADVEAAFARVLDSGCFIGGDLVEQFEQEWAAYCGTAGAVAVGNGTDAIHLALRALGVGPGDEVVVPANTFVATVEGVVLAGATPHFADVSPDTLLLTADTLTAALTPRTRAVVVVHLYGQMPDMDAICRVARSSGLVVIEDAAQAHGATWRGRPAGSFGHAGCFSFYPGKNLGAFGDAGAIVTDDSHLAQVLRSMRNHGRSSGSHHGHEHLGMNSRTDALQAAVLLAKLPRLATWVTARRALADSYRTQLSGGPVRLVDGAPGADHAYHLLVARVPDRARVRSDLAKAGIETGLHYPVPCHLQGPYQRFAAEASPVVEQAADEILSLPMYPHLAADQVSRVCERLQELVPAEVGQDVD